MSEMGCAASTEDSRVPAALIGRREAAAQAHPQTAKRAALRSNFGRYL